MSVGEVRSNRTTGTMDLDISVGINKSRKHNPCREKGRGRRRKKNGENGNERREERRDFFISEGRKKMKSGVGLRMN